MAGRLKGMQGIVWRCLKRGIAVLLMAGVLSACSNKEVDYDHIDTDSVQIDIDAIEIDETDADYLLLCNAAYFSDGPVGYSAAIPGTIGAFGRLFQRENAGDYFVKMERNANNQGKLYALCGLYYFEYEYYYKLVKEYVNNTEPVEMMSGCIRFISTIGEEIKIDHDSPVRLRNNADTVDEWCKRTKRDDMPVDFYGGGVPCFVKEYALDGKW